jgi:hypothetical protein
MWRRYCATTSCVDRVAFRAAVDVVERQLLTGRRTTRPAQMESGFRCN